MVVQVWARGGGDERVVGSFVIVIHGGLCGGGGGWRIWENFVKFLLNLSCLVCEKIWESENGMLFGCFVIILLWNGGL